MARRALEYGRYRFGRPVCLIGKGSHRRSDPVRGHETLTSPAPLGLQVLANLRDRWTDPLHCVGLLRFPRSPRRHRRPLGLLDQTALAAWGPTETETEQRGEHAPTDTNATDPDRRRDGRMRRELEHLQDSRNPGSDPSGPDRLPAALRPSHPGAAAPPRRSRPRR